MIEGKNGLLNRFGFVFLAVFVAAVASFAWAISAQTTPSFNDVFNADDVKLVNASESGLSRGYTPVCDKVDDGLYMCHLTLAFKGKPGIQSITLKEADFTYTFKTLKGNPVVKASGYDVFDGKEWVKLESVDVVAGEIFYVDLWAEIQGEDWQIDAIPEVLGLELSQFALWQSYNNANEDAIRIHDGEYRCYAQTFPINYTGVITGVNLTLCQVNNPSYHLSVQFWDANATSPTSFKFAFPDFSASDIVSCSGWQPTQWRNESLTNITQGDNSVVNGNYYALVMCNFDGTNTNSYYAIPTTYNSDYYSAGNMSGKLATDVNTTSAWTVITRDMPFEVYGEEGVYFDPALTPQTVIFDPEPGKGVLYYDANCTSFSNGTITYSDNASEFDIDSSTGVIIWEPSEADIGSHSFEITCADEISNSTTTLPVTVSYVTDLAIFSETIYLSNSNPQAGDTVTITARVFNFGLVDASDVPVSFYNETTLIETVNISSVPKDSYAEASIQWVVPSTSCYRVLSVAVDAANNFLEEDELNNNASRYILVGGSASGGIQVDNQTITPSSATVGSVVTISGDAWYDTTYGWGEKVAGAFVNISIGGIYAGNGRTIADGTFSVAAIVPSLTPGSHNVTITVYDGTFEQEVIADFNATNETFSVTVPSSPAEQRPDPAVTSVYAEPSVKLLDNMTGVKLKADIHNYGQEVVTDANVSFYDNGVFLGSNLVSVLVGTTNTTEIDWNLTGKGNTTRIIMAVIDSYPNETTTSNNARTTIPGIYIHLIEPHKADLRVNLITFSNDNPYENDNVTITAYLENTGVVDATADVLIWDEYDDYGVYSKTLIENTTAFIPDGTATVTELYAFGMSNYPHNVTVELDPYNKIDEINEEDNNLTRQITIKQRPILPDFVPTELTFSDSSPIIGQNIGITANVTNIGITGNKTNVSFYSNNQEIGTEELYVEGSNGVNTTTIYHTFSTSGDYIINVTADPAHEVSEDREDNNELLQSLRVYSDQDLAIYSPPDIEFSTDGPLEGENLIIHATVENVGNSTVSNFNASADRDGGITYDIEPSLQEISSIGVGENYTVNFTWVNVNGDGSHVIRIEIDPELSLDEPHANNTATRAIIVGSYADFRVFEDDITFDPEPEYQQPTNMSVTVHNNGSDQGNVTALIYVNLQRIYNQTITLAANVSTVITTEWIPNAYDNTVSVMLVNVYPGERNSTDNTAEKIVHFLSVPYLTQEIPDITFYEDFSNTTNLSEYFKDDDPAHSYNLGFSYETNDSNVTITISNGIANVSAAANWYGYALVNFTANDSDQSMNRSNEVLITVIPINDAPQIDSFNASSENGTYTSTEPEVTFSENETAAFEVEVFDAEEDSSQLWYEWFLNGILKLYGWGKSVFEWAFGFEDAGEYNVTVVVNDSTSEVAAQEWNVTVQNLNRPPYFVDVTAPVGQELNYQVNCSDYDNEPVYYYDDASQFDIGLSTGLINWTPTANDVGLLTVNIICGDAEVNQTREYYIEVS